MVGTASLALAAPEVQWLKMSSGPQGYVAIKVLGGKFTVNGTCITSWDTAKNQVDDSYQDGRAFLLARDGGRMDIDRSELRYLGHSETESYGLSWRLEGSGGSITNSIISHLYFGLYSFEVGGLEVTGQRGLLQRGLRHRPAHRLTRHEDPAQRRARQRQARHHPRRGLHRTA